MKKAPKFETLPSKVNVYSGEDIMLLPGGQLPMTFSNDDEIKFVEKAIRSNRLLGVIQSIEADSEMLHFSTGCLGRIINFNEIDEGIFAIVKGICRFDVTKPLNVNKYMQAIDVDYSRYEKDISHPALPISVDRVRLMKALGNYMEQFEVNADWDEIQETPDDKLVTALAMSGPFTPLEKQALIESVSLPEQCCIITTLMEMALLDTNQTYQ